MLSGNGAHAVRDFGPMTASMELATALRTAVGDRSDGVQCRLRVAPGDRSLESAEWAQVTRAVMFTPALLDAPQRLVEVQLLSPLVMLPAMPGQGIGTALVRAGWPVMLDRAVPVMFLEGDRGYYSRLGFAAGAPLGFRKPSLRISDVAFQAFRLATHEPWMTGTLVYSETCWRLDVVGLRDDGVLPDGDGTC